MVLWNGDSGRLHVRKAQYKFVTILALHGTLLTRVPAGAGTGVRIFWAAAALAHPLTRSLRRTRARDGRPVAAN
jgi:hypothetical protein